MKNTNLSWISQLAVLVIVGGSPADSSSLGHIHSFIHNVSDNNSDEVYSERNHDDYDALYDSDGSDEDYETIYDAIRDEIPALLTQVERRYKSHIQHHTDHVPLLSLVAQVTLTPSHPDWINTKRLLCCPGTPHHDHHDEAHQDGAGDQGAAPVRESARPQEAQHVSPGPARHGARPPDQTQADLCH